MQVVFDFNWDELIGGAEIGPDGYVHITLYDPRIISEVKKHKKLKHDAVISINRVPAEDYVPSNNMTYDYIVGRDGKVYPIKSLKNWEEKKMRKVERKFTVVALECTGENMLLNQVQVVADGYMENLTFVVQRDNCPDLGAKITVTIEQEV